MGELASDLPVIASGKAQKISWAERQHNRAAYLSWLLGAAGTRETMQVIRERLSGAPLLEERHFVVNDNRLEHSFHLTTAVADVATFVDVVHKGEYRLPHSLDRIINGKPIIDLGANIGTFTACAASRYPDSVVLAIEPSPRNFELLEQNVHPYGLHAKALNRAFALYPGSVPLVNPEAEVKGHHVSYSFRQIGLSALGNVTIARAITPENIVDMLSCGRHRVGLLKVDIEGAEKEIFESEFIDPLLQITNVLAIEDHERLLPGCTNAIHSATARSGMVRFGGKGNTSYFRADHLAPFLDH